MSARVDNTTAAGNRHAWTMMGLTVVPAVEATKLLGDPVLVSVYNESLFKRWFQNLFGYMLNLHVIQSVSMDISYKNEDR